MSVAELVASLDDAPDTFLTPDGSDSGRYRIPDDGAAAWAMRRLAAVRRRQREIQQVVAQEVERIEAWAAKQSEPLERDAAYFEGLLGEYARTVRDDPGDGRKSVSTPYGVVQTRATRTSWQVTDQGALLEWAKGHRSDLVTITERVLASDAARVLAASEDEAGRVFDPVTADEVPGIVAIPGGVSVSFTLDKGPGDGAA